MRPDLLSFVASNMSGVPCAVARAVAALRAVRAGRGTASPQRQRHAGPGVRRPNHLKRVAPSVRQGVRQEDKKRYFHTFVTGEAGGWRPAPAVSLPYGVSTLHSHYAEVGTRPFLLILRCVVTTDRLGACGQTRVAEFHRFRDRISFRFTVSSCRAGQVPDEGRMCLSLCTVHRPSDRSDQ